MLNFCPDRGGFTHKESSIYDVEKCAICGETNLIGRFDSRQFSDWSKNMFFFISLHPSPHLVYYINWLWGGLYVEFFSGQGRVYSKKVLNMILKSARKVFSLICTNLIGRFDSRQLSDWSKYMFFFISLNPSPHLVYYIIWQLGGTLCRIFSGQGRVYS